MTHQKKDIAKAIKEARKSGGFTIEEVGKKHRWGVIHCDICGDSFTVFNTPKNATSHAKRIREFTRRHDH